MRALKQELNQPENYLRQVLEGIAHLVRNGSFANHWQLQRDYQESNYDVDVKAEAAPIADYGDGQDMDDGDEDNVKLEDVLPS